MLDESHPRGRPLSAKEKAVLAALLGCSLEVVDEKLPDCVVEDMADGGMGSIRFINDRQVSRSFGATIAEATYVDADGVTISIALNVDERGDLFELDIWKVDFSPLSCYPAPEQLQVKFKDKS